ncbi:hypothetical protein E8E12_005912 [Didymella heteroderae]|uniref:Uncharacterized protein n=1 Tax=Didymella heteroderae TaxID=1769908 RepID=A0A9P4WN83_9PLEO|nr:hypothetical protein E8E12_005912 [Didymella heteroderae]
MPFFTSTSKATKNHTPVFAGLDDPFNFPASKMRYNTRSASPVSTADSGYGSIDDSSPLSPKAQVFPQDWRRLQKDGKGHWRTFSYELQSEHNDHVGEREPILVKKQHVQHTWRPDPKRTFTAICNDRPRREKWYTKRVHVKAMERKDRQEGLTDLQRAMAPVLRRAEPEPSLRVCLSVDKERRSRPESTRNESTLLHPSASYAAAATPRGRPRKPSTLLHPSPPPLSTHPPPACDAHRSTRDRRTVVLRSPRHREPTPLGIPMTSDDQPAPTPLRIKIGSRKLSGESVLHSCFSDDESGDEADAISADGSGDEAPVDGGDGDADGRRVLELSFGPGDGQGCEDSDDEQGSVLADQYAGSILSVESAVGEGGGVVLARTALVARAQRVKVRSPGLRKNVDEAGL